MWLATDRAYKTAEDAIARKRSSLKNVSVPEQLPDFSKAAPVEALLPMKRDIPEAGCLEGYGSEAFQRSFRTIPKCYLPVLRCTFPKSTNYIVNSEGTILRVPEDLTYVRVRAHGPGRGWHTVHDARLCKRSKRMGCPRTRRDAGGVRKSAKHVTALAQAPAGESYDGPVCLRRKPRRSCSARFWATISR